MSRQILFDVDIVASAMVLCMVCGTIEYLLWGRADDAKEVPLAASRDMKVGRSIATPQAVAPLSFPGRFSKCTPLPLRPRQHHGQAEHFDTACPGANCDVETQFAFELAGGLPQRIHINRLREIPKLLHDFQILVIPGGFTYGDDVAAGKILACQLTHFLGDVLRVFRDQGKADSRHLQRLSGPAQGGADPAAG